MTFSNWFVYEKGGYFMADPAGKLAQVILIMVISQAPNAR
ncbi:hypothetical protein PM8797T_04410 [Gimesia maris DSM 8797]|nr:hypothetical protein PM8797T_04410 [Gimesia maris DSM 8797]